MVMSTPARKPLALFSNSKLIPLPPPVKILSVPPLTVSWPKPEITIHMINTKSGKEVDWELPKANAPSDHPSAQVTAPSFVAPPVQLGSAVEPPLFEAPPAVTPSLDVPVADLPPTVDAPSVDTLPTLPPTAGRP